MNPYHKIKDFYAARARGIGSSDIATLAREAIGMEPALPPEAIPLSVLSSPRPEAREEAVNDFRADELDAVMVSVDKWFDEGDPRLRQDPANRSADAREIALKAIESSRLAAPKPEGQDAALRSIRATLKRPLENPTQSMEGAIRAALYEVEQALEPAAPAPGTKGEA